MTAPLVATLNSNATARPVTPRAFVSVQHVSAPWSVLAGRAPISGIISASEADSLAGKCTPVRDGSCGPLHKRWSEGDGTYAGSWDNLERAGGELYLRLAHVPGTRFRGERFSLVPTQDHYALCRHVDFFSIHDPLNLSARVGKGANDPRLPNSARAFFAWPHVLQDAPSCLSKCNQSNVSVVREQFTTRSRNQCSTNVNSFSERQ